MLKLFEHNLENIEYPLQKKSWDIAGIIKGHNGFYKFDTRPLQKTKEGELGKYSSFNSEADKMVFETKDKWIIVDLEELHAYLKNNKLKKVYLQDLIFKLDWNITISK
jgi:hypothetical protein|tara:strand:- start:1035 stop:1358 length:324 start_codon:yes stop_codon:yes gene_type:complete